MTHNCQISPTTWWGNQLPIMVNSLETSWKSPSRYPVFGRPFTPKPLFQWYSQSEEILLNLGMKCWNSAFSLQGSRVIIAAVQVGAVKIYATSVSGVAQAQGKTRWNSIYFPPHSQPHPLNANVLICRVFENLTQFMTKLRVLVLSFPCFTDISII
jgi:hypothetical protein